MFCEPELLWLLVRCYVLFKYLRAYCFFHIILSTPDMIRGFTTTQANVCHSTTDHIKLDVDLIRRNKIAYSLNIVQDATFITVVIVQHT